LEQIFKPMSLKQINNEALLKYIKTLVPDNEDAERHTRTENIRNQILNIYETGQGANLSRGTLWGAYNAVTEYVDHVGGSDVGKKLNSIWFGSGSRLKIEAFELAKEMLN